MKEIWSFQTGGYVVSSPCLGPDEILYVGSNDNKVYAIDIKTRKEKWSFTTGDGVWSSPCLGPDGVLYVGSDDKKVYALKFRTKEAIIEEIKKEVREANKIKIIKTDKTVQIGGVILPVNQRYKNLASQEPFPKKAGDKKY